ncbi:MAG: protoporphyrinogen oxidase [Candidatus Hydrogenedentes bacterium]|nr:protoporphyrinogen oxidase [Candidatus Hydrogenedentota bacterium]
MSDDVNVAVLGGGVTGLCAAYYLARHLGRDPVLLLEAANAVGGHTRTDHVNGFTLDWGPNGFLNREPTMLEWIRDLGISEQCVSANAAAEHRFILKNGRLMEVVQPPRFLLTSLLSLRGRARLLCEPLIAGKRDETPESIWDFAARRIGREAADTLVSPMVSGIFAGDAHQLSLAHCFPRMAAMEREYGSLFKALMAKKREDKGASPIGPRGVLTTFDKGIGVLPQAAYQVLQERIRLNASVQRLRRRNGGYEIQLKDGTVVHTKSLVLALPAYASAPIVSELDQDLAAALSEIEYAHVVVLCTAYSEEQVGHNLDGFGFLVPRNQGKRTLGCLWTSSLFPRQAAPGYILLRTMFGGATDPEAIQLSDAELVSCLEREVHPLLKIGTAAEANWVFRHGRGIAQYSLRHGAILDAIEAAQKRNPGLFFAGSAFRGVGLNDCVVSAHDAVARLTA